MFKKLDQVLSAQQVAELKQIASNAQFVDGKISNPHNKTKNNLHLNDQNAYQRSAQIMTQALMGHEDFRNFAFPRQIAPPLITRYDPGMNYGLHPDAAVMNINNAIMRSDLSCTIFLNDPDSYEGGALKICLADQDVRFKLPAGSAIVYPSTTLHEVEKVTRGDRLVGITFIQSQIGDHAKRELLYELNEVAALEGNSMAFENFIRLQGVQQNLLRWWVNS